MIIPQSRPTIQTIVRAVRFGRLSACPLLSLICLLALPTVMATAAGPRALPAGQTPDDTRLAPAKTLNGYFPFTPSATPAQWEARSERVKRQLKIALGLWPLPTKTPLNPVIHGKVDLGDYTVERVYFESYPGLYVTGSLFRPTGRTGKLPAVISPHGHFANGRFHDMGEATVKKAIADGAEKYEEGGRSPLQARCVTLARMGCVVFHYDMLGYADSQQISFQLAHRFDKQRPEMNTLENWGLFSTQAETHLQSIMGIQAYNSIRALDFVEQLPDVDPSRIGVTGASGGGTQTFCISAIDPRPAVSVPAVMVSTAMQGGCTCENCSLLRIDTGNVEFAALFAPKPLLMTAANDWTKEMETKGFPELRQHYRMMGAPDDVALAAYLQFGHNYNYVSRNAMYQWMNKHLAAGASEPVVERDYRRLMAEELTVWDAQHPAPAGGADFEKKLLRWMTKDTQQQLVALAPRDAASLAKYRQVMGGAVDVLVGRALPQAAQVVYERTGKTDRGNYLEIVGYLRHSPAADVREIVPIVFLHPKEWNKQVVIWADGGGKAALFAADGSPNKEAQALVDAGMTVLGVDLFLQGESLPAGHKVSSTCGATNPRDFAGYTLGYNHALFSRRVHDLLTTISMIRGHDPTPEKVFLLGTGGAGPVVAAAAAQARESLAGVAVDTGGFRFGRLTDLYDENFLPGGAKYDDLPGMLALAAPVPLLVAGEKESLPAVVSSAYKAAGAPSSLTAYTGSPEALPAAIVQWLRR